MMTVKENTSILQKKRSIFKILGTIIPLVVIVFFAFGFLFAPNDPVKTDVLNKYSEYTATYPLGTDDLGRCELSRLLEGGKMTISMVLIGAMIVFSLGVPIGMLFAQTSRRHNPIIEAILNAVTAIPPIAYLIIMISAMGNSVVTMLIALTVSLILRMVKLVMTLVELEYQKAYISCARSSGANKVRLLFVHILPNILREIIQFLCLSCSDMILAISGFSFIGLSMGDEIIDWGGMLSEASTKILSHPNLLLLPILCIVLCSFSFQLIGSTVKGSDEL